MKKVALIFVIVFWQFGCSNIQKSNYNCEELVMCESGNLYLTSNEIGSIYVDGEYTGKKTPSFLSLAPGTHKISVGLGSSRLYLKRSITVTDALQKVHLSAKDKVEPTTWKALFVGVPVATGQTSSGQCSTRFSPQDLDDAFDFFKHNLRTHIEPFSYNTVKWQIERRDLAQPVELTYNPKNKWYTLESEQALAELDNVQPGVYDTVFFFWREQEGDCSFKSSYFGLAWLEPTSDDARKTGYVTVKFNPGEKGVAGRIQQYLDEDPGVWTHEWLHVVIEKFYPDLNVKTPHPPDNKLILHSAGAYGYKFPWLDWYKDLISGQVPVGKGYSGIGPEALLNCTVRLHALNQCTN